MADGLVDALAQMSLRLGAGDANTPPAFRPPAALTYIAKGDDPAHVAVQLGVVASQPDGLELDAVHKPSLSSRTT